MTKDDIKKIYTNKFLTKKKQNRYFFVDQKMALTEKKMRP